MNADTWDVGVSAVHVEREVEGAWLDRGAVLGSEHQIVFVPVIARGLLVWMVFAEWLEWNLITLHSMTQAGPADRLLRIKSGP
ncbi:hypothetical protein ACFWY5_44080 [Nonomuraea sp. NPDC059007]|uniref:hypothetical protein n=1 Tax=Nonomuraea sp. NPDC059007 TaxID=3346692 RepID=UPI0036974791